MNRGIKFVWINVDYINDFVAAGGTRTADERGQAIEERQESQCRSYFTRIHLESIK